MLKIIIKENDNYMEIGGTLSEILSELAGATDIILSDLAEKTEGPLTEEAIKNIYKSII